MRRTLREEFVEDGPEEVDVGPWSERRILWVQHLWRHVGGCSCDRLDVGREREALIGSTHADCDAPVSEVDVAQFPHEHILGLQVSVQKTPPMREFHGSCDVHQDSQLLFERST